jgi:hypothetical protein
MKKIVLLLVAASFLFGSCKKSVKNEEVVTNEPAPAVRQCAAYDVLEEQLRQDPSLQQKMDAIESFTRDFQNNPQASRLLPNGIMEIPVVVNVLYKTASENVSDAQVQSQIDVLNEDFSAHNNDYSNIPSVFQSAGSGDCKIKFVLQNVVRKETNKSSWGTNDAMKKSNQGGIAPTSPATTLNIWVCTLGHGLLGYAQFPGGNPNTDGVVILNTAFGRIGTVEAPYDKGRTATHEIGHYFNLRHIWGDATCGNDFVDDTPVHTSYNFGCPSFPDNSSCGGTVHPMMTMNYMDYTDDACMFMFTSLQKTRMQASYASGGPRASMR